MCLTFLTLVMDLLVKVGNIERGPQFTNSHILRTHARYYHSKSNSCTMTLHGFTSITMHCNVNIILTIWVKLCSIWLNAYWSLLFRGDPAEIYVKMKGMDREFGGKRFLMVERSRARGHEYERKDDIRKPFPRWIWYTFRMQWLQIWEGQLYLQRSRG